MGLSIPQRFFSGHHGFSRRSARQPRVRSAGTESLASNPTPPATPLAPPPAPNATLLNFSAGASILTGCALLANIPISAAKQGSEFEKNFTEIKTLSNKMDIKFASVDDKFAMVDTKLARLEDKVAMVDNRFVAHQLQMKDMELQMQKMEFRLVVWIVLACGVAGGAAAASAFR